MGRFLVSDIECIDSITKPYLSSCVYYVVLKNDKNKLQLHVEIVLNRAERSARIYVYPLETPSESDFEEFEEVDSLLAKAAEIIERFLDE